LDVIEVTIAINVVEVWTVRVIDENGIASDAFEGTHGAVYSPWKEGLGFCK
jgi:hypothetical protein